MTIDIIKNTNSYPNDREMLQKMMKMRKTTDH
jgi:hypothetical protein